MSQFRQNLPTFSLYRAHCHASCGQWLCYTSPQNQLRLIQFNKQFEVKQSFILPNNDLNQPICDVKMSFNDKKQLMISVVMLTKYIIFELNEPIYSISIPLSCNIADFNQGFISCSMYIQNRVNLSSYFLTQINKVYMASLKDLKQISNTIFETKIKNKGCCLLVMNQYFYIGDDVGNINQFNTNTNEIQSTFSTNSNLPILNIIQCNVNFIVTSTCTGQLFILTLYMQKYSSICLHISMIRQLHWVSSCSHLYTVGEDSQIYKFQMNKNGILTLIKNYSQNKLINMIFTINNNTFITYYEDTIKKLL